MTTATAHHLESEQRRARPWWIVPLVVAVLLVLGVLAYGLRLRGMAQVDSGLAPPITLQTFDGQEITPADLQGKPVVVNFWASWCLECYDEAPLLEQAWRDHEGKVLFLGVDYVDTEPEALAYLERFGITYPNGPDLGSRLADSFRIRGVPETFFIGPDGQVEAIKIGPFQNRDEFDSYLAQIVTR